MKLFRRIRIALSKWYDTTAFLAGLEQYEEGIIVGERVTLWNDHVCIGANSHIYHGVTLWGSGKIEIGKNCEIGINTVICSSEHIWIGDNTLIAANCYIIDINHGIRKNTLIREQKSVVKGPVVIGKDVWLGAGVVVLSGSRIGNGAVIGAQSVVNSDIPENAIAVGVPAKVIGYRE